MTASSYFQSLSIQQRLTLCLQLIDEENLRDRLDELAAADRALNVPSQPRDVEYSGLGVARLRHFEEVGSR